VGGRGGDFEKRMIKILLWRKFNRQQVNGKGEAPFVGTGRRGKASKVSAGLRIDQRRKERSLLQGQKNQGTLPTQVREEGEPSD